MKTLAQVIAESEGALEPGEIEDYIAQAWLRPVETGNGWEFEEIDIARAQLVHHLRQDLAIDRETTDMVLSLLDQLYATRAQLHRIIEHLRRQAEEEMARRSPDGERD